MGSNDAETGSFNSADKEVDELIIREKGMNKKLTRCGELELAAGYCRKRLRRMSLSVSLRYSFVENAFCFPSQSTL